LSYSVYTETDISDVKKIIFARPKLRRRP